MHCVDVIAGDSVLSVDAMPVDGIAVAVIAGDAVGDHLG